MKFSTMSRQIIKHTLRVKWRLGLKISHFKWERSPFNSGGGGGGTRQTETTPCYTWSLNSWTSMKTIHIHYDIVKANTKIIKLKKGQIWQILTILLFKKEKRLHRGSLMADSEAQCWLGITGENNEQTLWTHNVSFKLAVHVVTKGDWKWLTSGWMRWGGPFVNYTMFTLSNALKKSKSNTTQT